MKVIKKFTAIKLQTTTINDEQVVKLSYGDIEGPYYSKEYPETEFDTEEEAIKYAGEKCKYSTWLIIPIIRFTD